MVPIPFPSAHRMAKAGLLGIIFAVLGTLLVFILGGPSRRLPPPAVPPTPQVADAGLQEFSFVQSKDGVVDWTLQASQAQVFDAEARALLLGVRLVLMGADGVSMTVEGDEGTINTSSKDFVIGKRSGDLALVLEHGYTIYTPRVNWVNSEHRFWTEEPVRIIGPNLEITGQGMDAFLTTREMRIHRNVRAGIY